MAPYLARPYGSYITLSTTVFLSFSSVMATPTPIADATALISNIDPFFPHLSLMPSHVAHLLSTCTYIAIGSLSVRFHEILYFWWKQLTTEQFTTGIYLGYSVPYSRRLPHCLKTSCHLADLCLFSLEVGREFEVNVIAEVYKFHHGGCPHYYGFLETL